jgi:antitoxin VapB
VVRSPADPTFDRDDMEVKIERSYEELRIMPVARRLDRGLEKFGAFSVDFMADG